MERLWARIASLALASLLALAVGGVVTAHARTVGEVIDDTRIVAEVTARLTADSLSNFVKIDVKAESGIVTLSGTVDSADKRSRAVQLASAVGGVKGVVNNIQVAGRTPTDSTSPTTSSGTIDATGTVASIDASSGTITLSDGRVLRADCEGGSQRDFNGWRRTASTRRSRRSHRARPRCRAQASASSSCLARRTALA